MSDNKSCPVCKKNSLQPIQSWHFSGGQIGFCDSCTQFFTVTNLPKMHYGVCDAVVGTWFEDISPLENSILGFTVSELKNYQEMLKKSELVKTKELRERIQSDLGRMLLEIIFYAYPSLSITDKVLIDSLQSTLKFVIKTDPSTYIVPIQTTLPKGTYEKENPIEYVPQGKSLIVFSNNLGLIIRNNFPEALENILNKYETTKDETILKRSKEPLQANHTYERWNTFHSLFDCFRFKNLV